MENKPKVEIFMATYNGSKYIAEQIDSISNQVVNRNKNFFELLF